MASGASPDISSFNQKNSCIPQGFSLQLVPCVGVVV
jgi:hypothetical protein